MELWRPVGMEELALIFQSGMRAFPPRLPEQPIFYPVLSQGYAEQIAKEWNTADQSFAGYVTAFEIPDAYAARFEPHVVGKAEHVELWVPAEQLEAFNQQIAAPIRVLSAYFGPAFRGHIPEVYGLKGHDANEQLRLLAGTRAYSGMDFLCETQANELTIYLNYPYWAASQPEDFGIDAQEYEATLEAIRKAWRLSEHRAPLVEQGTCVT
jgi:hypothetical protein